MHWEQSSSSIINPKNSRIKGNVDFNWVKTELFKKSKYLLSLFCFVFKLCFCVASIFLWRIPGHIYDRTTDNDKHLDLV